MVSCKAGRSMLCKVAQIRYSFQPLDHSCPCNGVVGILYVKGYTDEVWALGRLDITLYM